MSAVEIDNYQGWEIYITCDPNQPKVGRNTDGLVEAFAYVRLMNKAEPERRRMTAPFVVPKRGKGIFPDTSTAFAELSKEVRQAIDVMRPGTQSRQPG